MGDWLRTIFYGKQLVADRQQCRNTDIHFGRAQAVRSSTSRTVRNLRAVSRRSRLLGRLLSPKRLDRLREDVALGIDLVRDRVPVCQVQLEHFLHC